MSDAATLRRWTTGNSDVDAVLAAFAHPDVARQAYDPPVDHVSARAWIERRLEQDSAGRDASFAICVEDVPVGGVRLSSISRGSRSAWIGYWLAPEGRGRGLATRAVATTSRWAFDELDLFRIVLSHRTNNPESGAVADRAGFVSEGVERAVVVFEGERFDARRCSLLRTDPVPTVEPLPIRT